MRAPAWPFGPEAVGDGPEGTGMQWMQWRITIVSSLTSTSLTRSRTIRCHSRTSRVSAADRKRVRNAERVSARRRCAARSRICSTSAFSLPGGTGIAREHAVNCVNASRRCDTNWIAGWRRPRPPNPRGSARKRWSVPPGRAVKTRRRLCRSGRVRHPGLVSVAQFAVPRTTPLSDVRASPVSVGSRRGAARRMSR